MVASVRDWRRDRASKSCVDEGFVCRGGRVGGALVVCAFWARLRRGKSFSSGRKVKGLDLKRELPAAVYAGPTRGSAR